MYSIRANNNHHNIPSKFENCSTAQFTYTQKLCSVKVGYYGQVRVSDRERLIIMSSQNNITVHAHATNYLVWYLHTNNSCPCFISINPLLMIGSTSLLHKISIQIVLIKLFTKLLFQAQGRYRGMGWIGTLVWIGTEI